MNARIAVIILNHNTHQMTSDCISSLLAMDAKSYEVVVVDNGSSDGSAQRLARKFPQITVILRKRNLGFAGQIQGVKTTIGDRNSRAACYKRLHLTTGNF
jgi:hypothetical protein